MTCSSCGTENRADRKFCASCGAPLSVRCDTCGTANLPGERFCGECGSRLPATAGPGGAAGSAPGVRAAVPPGGPATTGPTATERRLVSVLFADLVGFTRLSEALDVEAVRDIQSQYFAGARAVIARYGGVVEKFIGDAVMAVWGAPVAHEDDAERAVRAALDLVDAVAALGERIGRPDLAARAGVLTGEAAVAVRSDGEGMVTGDLVNTAARIQSVAPPGAVLVGDATRSATEAAIAYKPVGEQLLKGKAAPVATWRADHVVAGRGGALRSEQVEAPFVGRAAELRALKDALDAVGREQRAQLVTVVGQAGIGKTRLAWELEKHVDGIVEAVYWHRGRSPAYGEGLAFWAIADMVRSRAGIAEHEDAGASGTKLAAMLAAHVADADDRRWIEPHLRALLGLDPSAGADRSEQFAAWRRLFEAIAGHGTTVLVFEDLQWADAGVLDFIESLLEWSRSLPILVLALTRPELLDQRPTFGMASRNALRLHLEPLSEADTRALLAGVAPALPEPLVRAVVERAQGVPLYAIELVRMLRAGGQDPATVEPSALSIPPSLQALVAARLDGLGPEQRAIVQDASVLGESFTLEAIAAVAGRDPADVEAALHELVRRELLALDADPRSPERGQYRFVQAVVREVSYAILGRRERRLRHLAAARYFETLDDPAVAQVLAAHYLEAYRASPDDEQAAAIRVQARRALRASADRSAQLHNDGQAIRELEQALELTDDGAERAAILEGQAALAESAARYDEAISRAEAARDAYAAVSDSGGAARVLGVIGSAELKSGRHAQARAMLESAVETLDPRADAEAYARVASQLARVRMLAGDSLDAVAWADRALAAAGPLRLVEVIAETLNTRGVALETLRRFDESIATIQAAADLANAHHLSNAELRARFNLAGRLSSDQPAKGLEILRGGIELATRTGRRDWRYLFLGALASNLFAVGLWDESAALSGQVLADPEAPPSERADALVCSGTIAAARGDAAASERALREADALVGALDDPQRGGQWHVLRAEAALATGDLERARDLTSFDAPDNWATPLAIIAARLALRSGDPRAARAAIGRIAARGTRLLELIRLGLEGAALVEEGDRDRGVTHGVEAVRQLEALETIHFAADCALDMVVALGPDDPVTGSFAATGRRLFGQMGASEGIARLDEALARSGSPRRGAARSSVEAVQP